MFDISLCQLVLSQGAVMRTWIPVILFGVIDILAVGLVVVIVMMSK